MTSAHFKKLLTFGLLFTAVLSLTSCKDSSLKLSEETWFSIHIDQTEIQVKLALLPAERARGLMFVKELQENQGMLFISEKPQSQSFWMRNTEIALDLGFFNARGELVEIHPLQPRDETSVQSRSSTIQFALEMNQGWFRKHNLFPDTRPQLDLEAIRKAIEARGLSKQYPL